MGVRRGAAAIYLEANHPDVEEFLLSKDLLKGDNREKLDCNIAIILDEVFMKNLRGGSEKEKEIFSNILELRMKFGSPYIMFKHHAQNADPIWYKENNLKTEHSQLCCLLGDELVVTSRGNLPIKDLVNKRVQIWDGSQWTYTTTFEERGQTNSLIKIVFNDGTELVVTPNHRMVDENWGFVQAQDIMLGFKNATHSKRYKIVTEISQIVLDEPVPVYCPSIHTTGMFALANGLMTGNSEIFLHSDKDHTYTCMLSSVNLDKWEEWKDYRYKTILSVPMIGTIMLDAVVEEYIQKGKEKIKKAKDGGEISGLEKAVRFTEKGRSLALGTLGLHSLYQSKMLPFESKKARELNVEVHKFIKDEAEKATKILAIDLGEPEWCKGYGRRNTHLVGIAPTTTNSVLCNAGSPGIEPSIANYFVMTGAKGSFERKNKYLKPIVEKKFSNPDLIWSKIRENDGSIQNIEGFTKKEKEVFKTAYEIDQMEVVRQAGDRQHYVDQGQSLNLFFNHDADAKYIIDAHLLADEVKLKSLYYLRSTSEMNNTSLTDSTFVLYTREDCIYCQKAKALLDSLSISYTTYEKPEGRVPIIYVDGEKLDDGYASLLEMFNNIKPSSVEADKNLKEPSCTGCEG